MSSQSLNLVFVNKDRVSLDKQLALLVCVCVCVCVNMLLLFLRQPADSLNHTAIGVGDMTKILYHDDKFYITITIYITV